jgi:hypothetical protein
MNPQTIKDIKAFSTIEPEQIRKYDRMNVVVKFMEAKSAHPDFTKLQLCKSIGVSDSYRKSSNSSPCSNNSPCSNSSPCKRKIERTIHHARIIHHGELFEPW